MVESGSNSENGKYFVFKHTIKLLFIAKKKSINWVNKERVQPSAEDFKQMNNGLITNPKLIE